jgi:hypothetical protein
MLAGAPAGGGAPGVGGGGAAVSGAGGRDMLVGSDDDSPQTSRRAQPSTAPASPGCAFAPGPWRSASIFNVSPYFRPSSLTVSMAPKLKGASHNLL